MKHQIYWNSVVFNPTGVSTHHRELLKAVAKKGHKICCFDHYNSEYDKDGELKKLLYQPIDIKTNPADVFNFYAYRPDMWQFVNNGTTPIGFPVHEGSKVPPHWGEICNKVVRIMVPSRATKNLFHDAGVQVPIHVVPEGVNPDVFKLEGEKKILKHNKKEPFVFLSVNSWTGEQNDRKGTDLLIRAFAEEFQPEENVLLYLKISTFWMLPFNAQQRMAPLLPKKGKIPTIAVDQQYLPPEELPKLYRAADCFISPTMGEAWGMTIGEAMACGLPVVIPKNPEAGYMDFVEDYPLWIDIGEKVQADRRFFAEGNLMPVPKLESIKKRMREIFEMSKEKRYKLGVDISKHIRENYNWDKAADVFIEVLNLQRGEE